MRTIWRLQLGLALALFGLMPACGDNHDHGGEETHSPVEEACEHVEAGPYADITATAEAAGAPSANIEHTAVRITLVPASDGSGDNMGYVSFAADDAAEFAFFLSAEMPFAIFDASDSEVALEESADVTECAEVAKEHVADLDVGTYTLWFGPTPETQVSLVVEEAGHEGD